MTKIDTNGDGIIQVCEAENITELIVDNSNISSLDGLLSFRNLRSISCRGNKISTLDLSSFKQLHSIYCDNNNLTNLNIKGLSKLKILWCYQNQLTILDLSSSPLLESLFLKIIKLAL